MITRDRFIVQSTCLIAGVASAFAIRAMNPTSDLMTVMAAVLFTVVMTVAAERKLHDALGG